MLDRSGPAKNDRVMHRPDRSALAEIHLRVLRVLRFYENGTAKHAEHAKGGSALQVQDDAFDIKSRPTEVEQQAKVQACGIQIIRSLRLINLVNHLGCLQFDDDDVLDEQVDRIIPDHDPIVSNGHATLP